MKAPYACMNLSNNYEIHILYKPQPSKYEHHYYKSIDGQPIKSIVPNSEV